VNTYFIGAEETQAYAKDFLRRLERLESFPDVWCPITKSGDAIAKVMIKLVGADLLSKVQLLPVAVAREAEKIGISFLEGEPEKQVAGKSVLLLDGAIHSGRTMSRCAEEVMKLKPQDLVSYSLVTKAGASFVPTIWGVTIDETDRAFFLLEEIPNHRLDAGNPEKKQPPVHVERLDQRHKDRPAVTSGVASMDRPRWSDRLFQMRVSTSCTYVLVRGETIVGYLTIHFADDSMFIDEVAIDVSQKKRGYGGVLMRFADTLARQGNCRTVVLNAIESEVGFYEKLEYKKVASATPIPLDDETYWPMQRSVLYHQRTK
jgi:hypothetical protein